VAKLESASPPLSSHPDYKAVPNLVGLSELAVLAQVGKPDETAAEGAGQTLIWRAGSCSLGVTFFLDVTRNQYFALSQALSDSTCAERIAARVSSP